MYLSQIIADEEGDMITVSSDDELMLALGSIREDVFRIYIKGKFYCLVKNLKLIDIFTDNFSYNISFLFVT